MTRFRLLYGNQAGRKAHRTLIYLFSTIIILSAAVTFFQYSGWEKEAEFAGYLRKCGAKVDVEYVGPAVARNFPGAWIFERPVSVDIRAREWSTPPSSEILCHVCELRFLKKLNVAFSLADDNVLQRLENISRLTELDISSTQVSDASAGLFAEMVSLESFVARDTVLGDKSVAAVCKSKNLSGVDLGGTRITDGCMDNIGNSTRLKKLVLSFTALTDSGLSKISHLEVLEYLDIWETQCSDQGIAKMGPTPALSHVNLTTSRISGTADLFENGRIKSIHYLVVNSKIFSEFALEKIRNQPDITAIDLGGNVLISNPSSSFPAERCGPDP